MHYDCLFDGEKCWILICIFFAIQWQLFLQKFIDTFHVQNYLRFLSKHARVYIYIFIDTGEDKWMFASTWQGKEEEKNEVETVLY